MKALAVPSNLSRGKACHVVSASFSETMLNLQSFFALERPSILSLLLNGALAIFSCLVLRVCCLPFPCALLADKEI